MTTPIAAMPDPVKKGRFNLYATPDGGFHIAYQEDGSEKVEHLELPGALIRAGKMMEEGKMSPLKMLGMIKDMM